MTGVRTSPAPTQPNARPRSSARPRRCGGAGGSVTVEMALATPLLVLFLLFAVACGRLVTAQLDVDAAAHAAARAASLARTIPAALADARRAATDTLAAHGATCRTPTVRVALDGLRPGGGVVTATVTCTVPLADLTLVHLPGARTVSSTSAAPIDVYRAVSLPGPAVRSSTPASSMPSPATVTVNGQATA